MGNKTAAVACAMDGVGSLIFGAFIPPG